MYGLVTVWTSLDDGPYWVILLKYGSHDMRQTSFHQLTVVNGTLGFWGITRYPKHVRVQIVQTVGRGLPTVERLPTAYDILHLVRPGSQYFHSRRLRPMWRSITVGYNPVRQCGLWQPEPHKLRPIRPALSSIQRRDYLKCPRNRIGLLRLYPGNPS